MKKYENSEDDDCDERRPAITPKGRENQMIALAVDTAEKQMLEGRASSQIIVHYLKLATEREKLEQKALMKKIELMSAKTETLQAAEHIDELYKNALDAMRSYH